MSSESILTHPSIDRAVAFTNDHKKLGTMQHVKFHVAQYIPVEK